MQEGNEIMSQTPKRNFQLIAWIIKVNILMIGFFLILVFIYNINSKGLPPGLINLFGATSSPTKTYKAKMVPVERDRNKAKVNHQSN
jgi:hypothetical protein